MASETNEVSFHTCSCTHAPEEHNHRHGCVILGCGCKWLGAHAKPYAAPGPQALGLDGAGRLAALDGVARVELFLAGKARRLVEVGAAANIIVRETNREDLADGAQAMANMIALQRAELKKLREELAAKSKATIVVNVASVKAGSVGDFAEELRKVLEKHGLEG